MRHRDQAPIQPGDDPPNHRVRRCGPALLGGDLEHRTMHFGGPGRRATQRHPLDQDSHLRRYPMLTPIGSAAADQTGSTLSLLRSQPTTGGAFRNTGGSSRLAQRDAVMDMRAQDGQPLVRTSHSTTSVDVLPVLLPRCRK